MKFFLTLRNNVLVWYITCRKTTLGPPGPAHGPATCSSLYTGTCMCSNYHVDELALGSANCGPYKQVVISAHFI